MIFLSHNYKDKPIVEQFALRLREIFTQDKVFYDSWSIQPGDGIIDKMNQGLNNCKLFLFFVSKNSLQSKMVDLEWQNALIKATKGQTKIVPVKLDDCFMPPILLQTVYIDLFGQGLEVALRQIVDVSTGRNTFQAGPQEFSNLRAYKYLEEGKIYIECHAEYYLEPISHFLFLTMNRKCEIDIFIQGMSSKGFHENIKPNIGIPINGYYIGVERGTVPGFPLRVEVKPKTDAPVNVVGVMHEKKQNIWKLIPLVNSKK